MQATMWVILAMVTMLIAYDFYANARWGWDGTISAQIVALSYRHPLIPFLSGVLCGHLFWQHRQ